MLTTKPRAAVMALALVLLAVGLALAGTPMSENFGEIKSAGLTAAFTNLDGSDSTTWSATTPLAGRVVHTAGDGLLEVGCRLSSPNATCCVVVGHRLRDSTFRGVADVQTATAGGGATAVYDGTGYWSTQPLYFHVAGWEGAEIRVYDVSGSSTVSIYPVTQGVAGRTSE